MNEVLIVSRAVAFVFYPSLSSKNWNTSHCREWCAHSDGRDAIKLSLQFLNKYVGINVQEFVG